MNYFCEDINLRRVMLGERLKALRKKHNLGQADVAAIVDVSSPTVSEWESGKKRPRGKKLKKLSEYFNVSLDYLEYGVERFQLSKEEESLIECYRNASDSIKNAINLILKESNDKKTSD